MHELSIAISLLEMAEEEAARRGNVPVEVIHVKIGALSGVVPDALRGAFDMARAVSVLYDTRLEITEVSATGMCPACGTVRDALSTQELICPVCRTPLGKLLTGREMEMTALEIAS